MLAYSISFSCKEPGGRPSSLENGIGGNPICLVSAGRLGTSLMKVQLNDTLLTCDSLGVGDVPGDLSNYDKEKIAQFEARITITDQVFVELVWNDNVHDVPSNSGIALKVLERVTNKILINNQL